MYQHMNAAIKVGHRRRTLRPTKADPSNLYTVSALAYLQQAHQVRVAHVRYHNVPNLTEEFQSRRTRALNNLLAQALTAWRMAGRTRRTLQPYIDQSQRVNGIRWMFPGEV